MAFCALFKMVSLHIWLADSPVVSSFDSAWAPVESLIAIFYKRKKEWKAPSRNWCPKWNAASVLCMHLLIVLARCGREGFLLQMLPEEQQRAFQILGETDFFYQYIFQLNTAEIFTWGIWGHKTHLISVPKIGEGGGNEWTCGRWDCSACGLFPSSFSKNQEPLVILY